MFSRYGAGFVLSFGVDETLGVTLADLLSTGRDLIAVVHPRLTQL